MNGEGEPGFIEAEATVLSAEEGGRRTAIFSGYRPNWRDAGSSDLNPGMGSVEIVGADSLAAGATGKITITTVPRSLWLGLASGSRLDMGEGPILVARVTVTRVVREPTVDW
jgi:translation elongation factor EF-Tu-like GTPase